MRENMPLDNHPFVFFDNTIGYHMELAIFAQDASFFDVHFSYYTDGFVIANPDLIADPEVFVVGELQASH